MTAQVFTDKTLLVTGGTGSFGHAIVDRFLETDIGEIRVFSRDEAKQDAMRHWYQHMHPECADKIRFHIGDVRDPSSIRDVMYGVDFVFHAAALKQVPSCEFFPIEAVKTNVLGTEHVLNAAIRAGVARVVCLSTDKAAYPINAMGTSKAMMEKVFVAKSRTADGTLICGTRYGNVLCSRGSVVPLFVEQLKAGQPLTVTDPLMTRFIMTLEEAVGLVLFAFMHATSGDIFVQKAPAATVGLLARAVCELFGVEMDVRTIGIRHGEKNFETLLTLEECVSAVDLGDYYRVPADKRDLNYEKYFSEGMGEQSSQLAEYTSRSTQQMTLEHLKEKLLAVPFMQSELQHWRNPR